MKLAGAVKEAGGVCAGAGVHCPRPLTPLFHPVQQPSLSSINPTTRSSLLPAKAHGKSTWQAWVQAFFADIYTEATRAHPAPGHHALAELLGAGRLHRHYTLNIDGLAGMVGMDTWHPETNPNGEQGGGTAVPSSAVVAGCRGHEASGAEQQWFS